MAYKEKDTKKWSAQWFETTAKGEKKKRRKRGFETKREALEYEWQKKLSSSRSMDMKLSEFMEVYFEDKQNELKDRTMKNKRYMMEQHIIPYFGEQMLSEITASQIIQWQNEMQTKGFSESYLRMIQNQLICIFTHASRIYDLHTNPCKKVKRMGNSDSRSLDFWTTEEYQRFIHTIEPGTRYYLIFEILFWTGCSITKTYYRTGRQGVITEPKTKQSVRTVEIPEFLKLDTRVTLKNALAEQGFKGGTRSATKWNQWIESEKQELSKVADRYGVRWRQLGTHNKHLSVLDFEKQGRTKEVAKLEQTISGGKAELSHIIYQQVLAENEMEKIKQENESVRQETAELSETNDLLRKQRMIWNV